MVSKLLPFGPLLMVSVWGGAELTKCSAAQTRTAHTSRGGPTVWTNARKETSWNFAGISRENLPFDPVMLRARGWSTVGTHDSIHRLKCPARCGPTAVSTSLARQARGQSGHSAAGPVRSEE